MNFFNKFSKKAGDIIGSSWAFFLSVVSIVIWLAAGPFFNFSEDWQLVVNTGTTIITFLIAFLIQHSQNRDTHMVQLKLDELIRAVKTARNERIDLDDLSDEELLRLEQKYKILARKKQKIKSKRNK